MTWALEMIERERNRQIDEEGFTAAYDNRENADAQLAVAAACYLVAGGRSSVLHIAEAVPGDYVLADSWPWPQRDHRHRHDRLRRLVIGAALALAAIDQEIGRLGRTDDQRNDPAAPAGPGCPGEPDEAADLDAALAGDRAAADRVLGLGLVPASRRPGVPASPSAEPHCPLCYRPAVLCSCHLDLAVDMQEGEP